MISSIAVTRKKISKRDPATGERVRPRRRTQRAVANRPASAPSSAEPAQRPRTLDRVVSKAGLGSRTEAQRWIREGRVRVNNEVVEDPERWVRPGDRVLVNGKPLVTAERVTLVLYKPKGYLTTYSDPEGRPTVFDLMPKEERYLFPVGRLDLDTSGLLLLTNDPQLAETLTNPKYHVPKTYLVKTSTQLTDEQLDSLRRGLELDDGPTRPARVTRLRDVSGRTVFEITITEGRNRQVRRMVEAVGSKVLKLVRVAIGPLRIGDLTMGAARRLEPAELTALRRAARAARA